MKVQTFLGKLSMEALKQMDTHINDWLAKNNVEPKLVSQMFGYESHHHDAGSEPVVVTSIWY